ncbi:MAG: hypothetical protein E7H33_09745 [Clostridium perfringens]|nr:hypothetical protein [Clostridium perfringens]
MKNFSCNKCGSVDVFIKENGNQKGLYCSDCCTWLKWVSKRELPIVEEYINRNKVENEIEEDMTQKIVNSIDDSLKDALEYNLRKFAIEKGFRELAGVLYNSLDLNYVSDLLVELDKVGE